MYPEFLVHRVVVLTPDWMGLELNVANARTPKHARAKTAAIFLETKKLFIEDLVSTWDSFESREVFSSRLLR